MIRHHALELLLTLFASLSASAPAAVYAQAYPNKPVRLIVPAAPAGTTDILARMIAQKLTEALGQSVLVENRAGAGGIIGTEAVAKATPDGHTLIMGNIGPNAINYSLYKKLPYQASDLAAVALAASVPNVLVVPAALPVASVADLVALAKAKPGQIAFASSGSGQSIHLSGELFRISSGLNIVHVPYKGSGPALIDLVAGQVALMFDNLPSSLPLVNAGKLRALAVTSAARVAQLPNAPTMIESGFPGFEVTAWFGVLAPAKTPDVVIQRLNTEVVRALQLPEMRTRLTDLGATPGELSPQQFTAFMQAETEKWAKVVKSSGLQLE